MPSTCCLHPHPHPLPPSTTTQHTTNLYVFNSVHKEDSLGKQEAMTLLLASVLTDIRPELDVYNFSDLPVERVAVAHKSPFRRIFYHENGDMQV